MEALTDERRYPLLTQEAHRFLQSLREHPHSPAWNHRCGDRLTADGLARVRAFEQRLTTSSAAWTLETLPEWMYDFVRRTVAAVPHYRGLPQPWLDDGRIPSDQRRWIEAFRTIPPTPRELLASKPWMLVPDDCPLDDLIVYDTSGRTGHPIVLPTHPVVSSMYLPLLRAALSPAGVTLAGGPGRVAIVNACFQRTTFAFASVSSFLEWAGFAKVNLHESCWRSGGDRGRFLDACDPEIYTGDPISLAILATLPLTTRPKAVVSTSMEMPDAVRRDVGARFGCPVVDLYSLTESGPLAVRTADGYAILRPDVYVEALDREGRPCADGEQGEIVVTGGQNPFFPLLRYRTGDRGALTWPNGAPLLTKLEGRSALVFRDSGGGILNNVDLAAALGPLRLPPFRFHQHADGRVVIHLSSMKRASAVRTAVASLFGPGVAIDVVDLIPDEPGGPVARYTSDMPFSIP